MEIENESFNQDEPIFEIKKWNGVALWAWGKIIKLNFLRYSD